MLAALALVANVGCVHRPYVVFSEKENARFSAGTHLLVVKSVWLYRECVLLWMLR